MAVLTREQECLLLHMTGLDRADEPCRKHFAADGGEADPDWAGMMALVAAGFSRPPGPPQTLMGGLRFFIVTEAGVARAREVRRARKGTP